LSIALDLRADDAGDADLSAWRACVSLLQGAFATIVPASLALAVAVHGRRGLAIAVAVAWLVSLPWFPLWGLAGATYESRVVAVCVSISRAWPSSPPLRRCCRPAWRLWILSGPRADFAAPLRPSGCARSRPPSGLSWSRSR